MGSLSGKQKLEPGHSQRYESSNLAMHRPWNEHRTAEQGSTNQRKILFESDSKKNVFLKPWKNTLKQQMQIQLCIYLCFHFLQAS